MKLPPALDNLCKIKHATIIGIALTLILNICLVVGNLFVGSEAGYLVLMIGTVVVTFAVLYLFGIRKGKYLAIVGIVIFLVIGAINGPLIVYRTYSAPEPEPVSSYAYYDWTTKTSIEIENGTYFSSGYSYSLEEGILEPYKGQVGIYHFSVQVYSDATFQQQPNVRVAYIREIWLDVVEVQMDEVSSSDTNYLNGKMFECSVQIENNAIYYHWFALVLGSGSSPGSLNTTVAVGPLVGDGSSLYGFYAGIGATSMFCNVGLMFLIIVLLYWWLGAAKERRKRWMEPVEEMEETGEEQSIEETEEKPEEMEETGEEQSTEETEEKPEEMEEDEFTCTSCGAPVSASHNFCPKCGERFNGIEDEGPEKDSE